LPPRSTTELHLDVSYLYDVSEGGLFEVSLAGRIPFAIKGSTELVGSGTYSSNTIMMNITKGARPNLHSLSQKTILQSDCTDVRARETMDANALCALLSTVAGRAALMGDSEQ
jgi:deuterolysin